jgi:hypothetical protein
VLPRCVSPPRKVAAKWPGKSEETAFSIIVLAAKEIASSKRMSVAAKKVSERLPRTQRSAKLATRVPSLSVSSSAPWKQSLRNSTNSGG